MRLVRLMALLIATTVALAFAARETTAGDNAQSAAGIETGSLGEARYGAFGPQSPRMREQLWIMPGGAPATMLRATVFRPPGDDALRPVVIINHGTSEAARLAQAMPVFYWLSRWFVERGYAVVLPERRGHGATGGDLAEAAGTCSDPDHFRSGQIAADDIEAVVRFVRRQQFADPQRILVAGVSTGGWASLALAARNPEGVRAVVNFAGGRGGHAGGRANAVCGAGRLVEAAASYGKTAKIPTLWLYAQNDSYFAPSLAQRMAKAFTTAGGRAELHVLPPYADDGHSIADDEDGWDIWGQQMQAFLALTMHGDAPATAHAPRDEETTAQSLVTTSVEGSGVAGNVLTANGANRIDVGVGEAMGEKSGAK